MRILGGLGRALWWNAAIGGATGLWNGLLLASGAPGSEHLGGEFALFALIVAPLLGIGYGLIAGAAHGVAQLPLLVANPRHIRATVRIVATLVSAGLVAYVVNAAQPGESGWWQLAVYAPYVALTPFVAARGYAD